MLVMKRNCPVVNNFCSNLAFTLSVFSFLNTWLL